MEVCISGYCRAQDQSRMVWFEDGDVDCAFENCPFAPACEVGKRIVELLEEQK